MQDGFFDMKTAADLRRKLRRDFEKFQNAKTNTDAAFNFFVTAEHMVDWTVPPGKTREAREKDKLLLLCSHLANGAKHFIITNTKHNRAVECAGLIIRTKHDYMMGHGTGYVTGAQGYRILRSQSLVIDLTDEFVPSFGETIGALALAEKLMAYWEEKELS